MAFAVASKGAPLAAGLLNNLRRIAAPSSSLLGPASVAATRRLYSTGGAPVPVHRDDDYDHEAVAIGAGLVEYHYQVARYFLHAYRWWVSKQDEDAVEVTVAMPGLPAERVKVWANKKGLFVNYSCQIELSADAFDLDKAKAEMKDGLLKITVPRVKGTEIKIQ